MKLPFSIDRSNRIKLAYQVADGLREAIQNGKWKPGERLPSSREIKAALGTSVRAPAEALRMLADEGLITLREKCGAVVNERNMPQVKGRVLIIVPGGIQCRRIRRSHDIRPPRRGERVRRRRPQPLQSPSA